MSVVDNDPIDYEDDELEDGVGMFCPRCRREPDSDYVSRHGSCSHCDNTLSVIKARIAAAAFNNDSAKILLTGHPIFGHSVYHEESQGIWDKLGVSFWIGQMDGDTSDDDTHGFPLAMIGLCADRAWEEF